MKETSVSRDDIDRRFEHILHALRVAGGAIGNDSFLSSSYTSNLEFFLDDLADQVADLHSDVLPLLKSEGGAR